MTAGSAAPAWYPDPSRRHQLRWFDGRVWTDDVADNGLVGKDALASLPPGLQQWSGPPSVQPMYRPLAGPTAQPLAGYGSRLGGWLIDWVLLAVVSLPFLLVTHSIHHTHTVVVTAGGSVTRETGFRVGNLGFAIHALIVIAYGALLCGAPHGQTVGMRLVGVKVVDEHDGSPIGFRRALGRAGFEYLMVILFFVPWIVDMLFPLWDAKNQTLHDKVCKAVVVTQ